MTKNRYRPPVILKQWMRDEPDGELYQLMVLSDQTVCSAVGRFSHSSGARSCSWENFLQGDLQALVERVHGAQTLAEALVFVTRNVEKSRLRWWDLRRYLA